MYSYMHSNRSSVIRRHVDDGTSGLYTVCVYAIIKNQGPCDARWSLPL